MPDAHNFVCHLAKHNDIIKSLTCYLLPIICNDAPIACSGQHRYPFMHQRHPVTFFNRHRLVNYQHAFIPLDEES